MKILDIFSTLLITISPAYADDTVEIEVGGSYRATSGELVKCGVPSCTVEFHYVGKNYNVITPNGKKYDKFPTEEEALKKAKSFVDLGVCGRVVIAKD